MNKSSAVKSHSDVMEIMNVHNCNDECSSFQVDWSTAWPHSMMQNHLFTNITVWLLWKKWLCVNEWYVRTTVKVKIFQKWEPQNLKVTVTKTAKQINLNVWNKIQICTISVLRSDYTCYAATSANAIARSCIYWYMQHHVIMFAWCCHRYVTDDSWPPDTRIY